MRSSSPSAWIWSAVALASLGGAGCTASSTPTGGPEVPPPPELPVLVVDAPARGAFVEAPVRVSGHVERGTGALESLEIDDVPVAMDEQGRFEHLVDADPGMLLLDLRVEDALGERAVDGRAVQVGPVRRHDALIPRAVAIQLGPELLDDDDPDADDLASLAERIMEQPSFTEPFVGSTIEGDYYDVVITELTLTHADVDLVPGQGKLGLDAKLREVHTCFDAEVLGLFTVSGSADMDTLELSQDLEAEAGPDGVEVQATRSEAHVEGFSWEVEWIPGWVEDLLQDDVVASIEEAMADQAREMVGELVGSTLSAFAMDTSFGEEEQLGVHLDVADAVSGPEGLVLWLDGTISARRFASDVPVGAGPAITEAPPPSLPRSAPQPLLVAVDDDLLNQALFAVWASGGLGGITYTGDALRALTGGADLPPPLGPVASASLDTYLPPTLRPPTGEADMELSLGEVWVQLVREDGVEVGVSLSLSAPADLIDEGEGLGMVLDTRPSVMHVSAGMLAWPEGLDPGDLASLFRLTTPTLMAQASALFPSFEVPPVPIGELMDLDGLEGVAWTIEGLEGQVEPDGWLVLDGRVEEAR